MFLTNFELTKMQVDHPNLVNNLLFGFIFLFSILTLKKQQSYEVLERTHTDQLKGIAILLIIIGHLWTHVANCRPSIHLAGYGVSLFFFLSGYGLTVSAYKRRTTFLAFLGRRVKKVMLPYWLATALIVFLDFVLLDRSLPINYFCYTILGININSVTSHLDYSRWFITLLLSWYLLHYIIYSIADKQAVIVLFFAATILYTINYYFLNFNWYNFFSFPSGCLLAITFNEYKKIFSSYPKIIFSLSMGILLFVLILEIISYDEYLAVIPDIFSKLIDELLTILFCLSILTIFTKFSMTGIYSQFLLLTGLWSYELFLLHGALLIKYNPVMGSSATTWYLCLQFFIFLAILFTLSFSFRKILLSLEQLTYSCH